MKISIGSRRQLYLLVLLVVFAIGVVRWRSAPSSPVPPGALAARGTSTAGVEDDRPAPAARGRGSLNEKAVSADEVPIVTTKDLDPQLARRTRAICAQAGVKEGPLLDACTLDVAVIGSRAAKVFAAMPNPIAVGDARL